MLTMKNVSWGVIEKNMIPFQYPNKKIYGTIHENIWRT